MEEQALENDLIKEETNKRLAGIHRLEQTEGFKRLTERQQRIIKQSLYVQQRAERGTDPASRNAIVSPKTHVTEVVEIMPEEHLQHLYENEMSPYRPDERKYKDSQNHIADWYCHATIANLENEKGLEVKDPEIPEEFFQAEYQTVNTESDLGFISNRQEFPCVVHVVSSTESTSDWSKKHSFLILGHDSSGCIIVWDKQGYKLPYRVTTLREIYKEYKQGYYWGVRGLHKDKR